LADAENLTQADEEEQKKREAAKLGAELQKTADMKAAEE
jgi:hypothetical protein